MGTICAVQTLSTKASDSGADSKFFYLQSAVVEEQSVPVE